MIENTPTNHGEFLMCYHGQIFCDEITGFKERLTVVDISYVADGRKRGLLMLKPLQLITNEQVKILGLFLSASEFRVRCAASDWFFYKYHDQLRKMGFATEWRGLSIDAQLERKWISLYSK